MEKKTIVVAGKRIELAVSNLDLRKVDGLYGGIITIEFVPENITRPILIEANGDMDVGWMFSGGIESYPDDYSSDRAFEENRLERWQENNNLSPDDNSLLFTLISGFCNSAFKEVIASAY